MSDGALLPRFSGNMKISTLVESMTLLTMLLVLSSLIALNLGYPYFTGLLILVSMLPIVIVMIVVIGRL